MKKCCVLLVLFCILSETNSIAQSRSNSSASTSRVRLLKAARADWPKFLTSFRLALKKHDRVALRLMMSSHFTCLCSDENGNGDVRDKLLQDDPWFEGVLRTVSTHLYRLTPIDSDDSDGEAVGRHALEKQCYSADFRFRKDTGWQFVAFWEPAGGC